MPDPKTVLDLAAEFDAALARKDAVALNRLIKAYGGLYTRLRDKIDALTLQIGAEEMTRGQVTQLERYKSLVRQVENELDDFSGYLKTELRDVSLSGIASGTKAARGLVGAVVGADSGIMAGFNVLPTKTIERLLGFLDPEGPLYKRIDKLAGYNAKRVADAILEGVGLGHNPRKIAAAIKHEMGGGLTDALRMTRTAQIYSYREATRANYIVNSDVVGGWIWVAAIAQSRTCLSCISQHGTKHPLTETLQDHYNGRCAMIPAVVGAENPITQMGEDYFNSLPEAQQRQMMGNRYDMWKKGEFSFGDLSKVSKDEVYGDMRTVASAKDLRANGQGLWRESYRDFVNGPGRDVF